MADIFDNDLAGLYSKRIHQNDESAIDKLTAPKNWDFTNFRKSIIACSVVGEANQSPYYIPSHNIPETIHIGNLRKYINELDQFSRQTGNEFSRVFMVDTVSSELVAGKKVEGEEYSTRQGWTHRPGLVRALSIHTHPTGAGFSDTDYKTFMSDPEQIAMIMTLGKSTFLVLKNTATPNKIITKDVERRIDKLSEEFFPNDRVTLDNLISFNKTVCLEFGLNLFIGQNGDMLNKIKVTS